MKIEKNSLLTACIGLVAFALACSSKAQEQLDPVTEIQPFAAEVAQEHGIDEMHVRKLMSGARILPNVLSAMSRPAESKSWREYRPIFLNEKRIVGGVAFWVQHRELLKAASEKFGVDEPVIVAIIGVETYYGARAGSIRVLDALATLGFRFPRRAKFFRRELGHFMVLAQTEQLDVTGVKGSYAGAMGIPQFIPSSYREYSVDFDGDGRRDLIGNVADAIGSVASYFSRHGWSEGDLVVLPAKVAGEVPQQLLYDGSKPQTPVAQFATLGVTTQAELDAERAASLMELDGADGKEHWMGFNNFYVITRYNRSPLYAMAVHQLSQAIVERRKSGG